MKDIKKFILKSVKYTFTYPLTIFFSFLSLLVLTIIGKLSQPIPVLISLSQFNNSFTNTLWAIFVGIIIFIALGWIFSALVASTEIPLNGKTNLLSCLKLANKKFWKNAIVMVVITLISGVFVIGSSYILRFVGYALNFNLETARMIFILVLTAYLLGIVIFWTYASWFVILEDNSVKAAFRKSAKFVKSNYLETLLILLVFFCLQWLVQYTAIINQLIPNLISTLIIIPILAFSLTLLLKSKQDTK